MNVLVVGLIGAIALLVVAASAVPLARWIGQPVTVIFAAIGVALGTVVTIAGEDAFGMVVDSYDRWFIEQLALDTQSLLYLFLPPLLFEMALAVNVRRLMDEIAVVMVMAILAVLTAILAVGSLLSLATPLGLAACLLLGAAVATTDPGAVISTFREIGAPKRLMVILEGESLLNDAAAIAVFALLLGLIRQEIEPSLGAVLFDFLYSFGAGAAVGLGISAVAAWLYPLLIRSMVAEVSVTVAVAYGAFIAAEQVIGGSGVVAVVFAGLATGSAGFLRMGPGNWTTVRAIWAQIGFWSNALIMILAAALVPALILDLGWQLTPMVAVVYGAALAARAFILFALLPVMARLRLAELVDRTQAALVLWGGVRGSVTLVLALAITEISALGEEARLLGAIAASYTLATIFLNAATLAALTRLLGLNRLSATDLALREHIVAGAIERVRNVVRNMVRARDLEPEVLEAAEAALGRQREASKAQAEEQAAGARIPFGDSLAIGLRIVSGQESRLIRRAFEEGAISPSTAAALRLLAERIADAGRIRGRDGYEAVALASLRPGLRDRIAVFLQRRLGYDRPLAKVMEVRFATLLETERILRELKGFIGSTAEPMIGGDAAGNLTGLLDARHKATEDEIEAIATQYPAYALALEKAIVTRAALRRERQQYAKLMNDGVIEQELHDNLIADLAKRERDAARPPRLDLALTPEALVDRLAMFSRLDGSRQRDVAKSLRSRFATPGEVILQVGARGTEMYFIASGALEVEEGDVGHMLGPGDFFGELALLRPYSRRRSKVVSLGYSRLLVLTRQDLQRLCERDPDIGRMIHREAGRQLTHGFGQTGKAPRS